MKKKKIGIIMVLILILFAGYYFGLRKQVVDVTVHEVTPAGNETGTKNVQILGTQLSHGFLTDLFGLGVVKQSKNIPWYITRASAIAAYLLMFLVIIWGTGMTTGFIYRFVQPTAAWGIHKFISIAMSTLVFIHIGALLFDEFIHFGLMDILVPFAASYKPAYVGLGVISLYILLVIMITSMFFRNRSERIWHLIHLAVYPLFALALIHGLFTGTDSNSYIMTLIYRITGLVFAAVTTYRFSLYYIQRKIKSAA